MEIIKGGITSPKGFEAAAVSAQIKYEGRDDMALIFSETSCVAAGTFTRNVVKAAPVIWDREIINQNQSIHAVIINSGIANACTGQEGMLYCKETAQKAAEVFAIEEKAVLIGSTGVIGMQLPIDRIKNGIDLLSKQKADTYEAGDKAAKAIMTTDTCDKQIAVVFELDGYKVTMGGMAKGSGMIHPNMCTMLSYITTDACISKAALQKALSMDVENTYNMVSVDGDTSTNDTVLLLANGMAKNPKIEEDTPEFQVFYDALHYVNEFLAKSIAADGEGATALFEVQISGAATKEDAKKIAKSVACSSLTKTAIAGHDANWGRIICAMGYAGVEFDPEKVDLSFESVAGEIQIAKDGVTVGFDEDKASEILSQSVVIAKANIKMGEESAIAWGCDLTHKYIEINADYRS